MRGSNRGPPRMPANAEAAIARHTRESFRFPAMLALLAASLPTMVPAAAWSQDGALERAVKAAYLSKFVPFVDWPSSAGASSASPFILCIAGNDPFGSLIEEAVAGQRLHGRPAAVRRLSVVARDAGCDLLYAGGSPDQPVAAELAAVSGTPVLTITDAARNGGPKGVINFVIEDNRVRFEINAAAAAANGLTISSKLMSLAVDAGRRD